MLIYAKLKTTIGYKRFNYYWRNGFRLFLSNDKNKIKSNIDFVNLFDNEMKYIQSKFMKIEDFNDIIELAKESIAINDLICNLKVLNENVIKIHEKIGFQKYDLVMCNPPYFKYDEDALTRENIEQQIARHEVEIKLEDIFIEFNIKDLKIKNKILELKEEFLKIFSVGDTYPLSITTAQTRSINIKAVSIKYNRS